ncbi:MAG: hypothetical protein L6437_11980 [Kiritimatiellae bacterium]|nr:hypothetical protein [Kiritimatiellia bacterium]
MVRQVNVMAVSYGVWLWFWIAAGAGQGAVTVEDNIQGPTNVGKCIRIKNDYYELDLTSRGGQAVSFKTRYSSRQWLWPGDKGFNDSGRLFVDHVGWGKSSELNEYRDECAYTVEGKTESQVEVVFSGRLKEGILLVKRYVFNSGSPVIGLRYTIKNDSKNEVVLNLSPRFSLHASGLSEQNRCYRPYEYGVLVSDWNSSGQACSGEDEVKALYEGWTAVIQEDNQEGLLWLMELSRLKSFINRPPVRMAGWQYEEIKLSAGSQWITDYTVMVLKTFSNVVHASPMMVAGLVIDVKKEFDLVNPDNPNRPSFLLINHTLCRSTAGRLENVKLSGTLVEEGRDSARELPALDIGVLNWEPVTVFHKVTMKPDRWLKCVMTMSATGPDQKPIRETYEFYWQNPEITGLNAASETSRCPFTRQTPGKCNLN